MKTYSEKLKALLNRTGNLFIDVLDSKAAGQYQTDSVGRPGQSGSSTEDNMRQILSEDPEGTFKDSRAAISRGAEEYQPTNPVNEEKTYKFQDGTVTTARLDCKSGSPVIEIWSANSGPPYQKIHFEGVGNV